MARQPGEFSHFHPDTGGNYDIPSPVGREVLSRLAEVVIAPEARDLTRLDDPVAVIRMAASHLSRQHSLDAERTQHCFERLMVDGYGPTPPRGVELITAFVADILSIPRRVVGSGLFIDPLEFCEQEDPQAFLRRQLVAEVLTDVCTPFYTLKELSKQLIGFATHQETGRAEFLRIGHPFTDFCASPFLDLWLNKLYYVKVPIKREATGTTPRAVYNFRYVDRWRLSAPTSAITHRRQRAAWSKGFSLYDFRQVHDRPYVWGRWTGFNASPCDYNEADLIDGLTKDDIEWLPTVRPAVLDFKIRTLGILSKAAAKGTDKRLWGRVLDALNALPHTAEMVKRLLRIDIRYAGYNVLSGIEEQVAVPCIPGGLTNILEVVGHVEKELSIGTYDQTRAALGGLVAVDRLGRPGLVFGDVDEPYLTLVAKHDRHQIRAALDRWIELEAEERGFWLEFRQRMADAIDAEIQTTAMIAVSPKYYPVIQPLLSYQVSEIIRKMESGELSPKAITKTGKLPSAKFPTLTGLKWEEVTITFLSNHSIRACARGQSVTFSYAEAGFRDNRRAEVPDLRWIFFHELAKRSGELTWKDKETDLKKHATKAVSIIRGRLKALFGIEQDPFQIYSDAKGYKTRFNLRNESSEQDDGRAWNE